MPFEASVMIALQECSPVAQLMPGKAVDSEFDAILGKAGRAEVIIAWENLDGRVIAEKCAGIWTWPL